MDKIEQLWILLSDNTVCCCNEPLNDKHAVRKTSNMDPELISELVAKAGNHGWQCIIVADRNGVPDFLQKQFDKIKHRIVVPADYNGEILETTDVVFNCEQVYLDYQPNKDKGKSKGKAILRVSQEDLGRLAKCVIELLNRYTDVSIKHPDLLKYTKEDFKLYKQQLHEIGEWLLSKGSCWCDFSVDVLTNRFGMNGVNECNECGAGDTSLAVAPDGSLYFCPAAFRNGFDSCGHMSTGVDIANRQLFTREYALPCRDKCDALHCSRCAFWNKLATFEFCVPPENACRLAHIELEAQSWLGNEAVKRNVWNDREKDWEIPGAPVIEDPFNLVKVEDYIPEERIWKHLVLFTGRPEDLSPSMMLEIICSLKDRLDAMLSCIESGFIVSSDLILNNVLLYLHRKTVETYKNVIFEEGCPTVFETEILMHRTAEVLAENRL